MVELARGSHGDRVRGALAPPSEHDDAGERTRGAVGLCASNERERDGDQASDSGGARGRSRRAKLSCGGARESDGIVGVGIGRGSTRVRWLGCGRPWWAGAGSPVGWRIGLREAYWLSSLSPLFF